MSAEQALRQPRVSQFQAPIGAWSLRFTAMLYLSVLVIVPVLVIAIEGLRGGIDSLVTAVTRPQALSAR